MTHCELSWDESVAQYLGDGQIAEYGFIAAALRIIARELDSISHIEGGEDAALLNDALSYALSRLRDRMVVDVCENAHGRDAHITILKLIREWDQNDVSELKGLLEDARLHPFISSEDIQDIYHDKTVMDRLQEHAHPYSSVDDNLIAADISGSELRCGYEGLYIINTRMAWHKLSERDDILIDEEGRLIIPDDFLDRAEKRPPGSPVPVVEL